MLNLILKQKEGKKEALHSINFSSCVLFYSLSRRLRMTFRCDEAQSSGCIRNGETGEHCWRESSGTGPE